MPCMQPRRREFVKATGLAAVLGTTGLAGCNGILGGGGGGGSAAADWQYDPSSLADVGNEFFGSMNYGALYDARDQLPQSMQDGLESSGDSPISPSEIDLLSGVGGASFSMGSGTGAGFGSIAVTGSFEKSTVTDEIESQGSAEQTGEYEGYTLYENASMAGGQIPGQPGTSGSATVGAGDGAMVMGVTMSQGSDIGVTGQDAVETMIDASAGNATRLSDADGHVQQLSSNLGDATMVVGAAIDPSLVGFAEQSASGGMQQQVVTGLRAGGFTADVDGETTTFTFGIIYESDQRAEDSGIVGLVNGMSTQLEDQQPGIETVEASRDGSFVEVTLTGDTKTLLEQGQSQAPGTF